MSCPASVRNAGMAIKDFGHIWLLLCNEFLELGDLADLLEGKDFIFLVSINRETG